MLRAKGLSDGILVNTDDSDIPTAWNMMNAFLMHESVEKKQNAPGTGDISKNCFLKYPSEFL